VTGTLTYIHAEGILCVLGLIVQSYYKHMAYNTMKWMPGRESPACRSCVCKALTAPLLTSCAPAAPAWPTHRQFLRRVITRVTKDGCLIAGFLSISVASALRLRLSDDGIDYGKCQMDCGYDNVLGGWHDWG
jgi:hypothetical protein